MKDWMLAPDENRGSGRSHKQIEQAPENAIFITPCVAYHSDIAEKLGRKDMEFASPGAIPRLVGPRNPIVLDHSIALMNKEWQSIVRQQHA